MMGDLYETNAPPDAIGSDYCAISEESQAAGAYLSGDPVQAGSLIGLDIVKVVSIAMVILGAIAYLATRFVIPG